MTADAIKSYVRCLKPKNLQNLIENTASRQPKSTTFYFNYSENLETIKIYLFLKLKKVGWFLNLFFLKLELDYLVNIIIYNIIIKVNLWNF